MIMEDPRKPEGDEIKRCCSEKVEVHMRSDAKRSRKQWNLTECMVVVYSLSEDGIISVEVRLFGVGDEELSFIRIRARVGHGNNAAIVELRKKKDQSETRATSCEMNHGDIMRSPGAFGRQATKFRANIKWSWKTMTTGSATQRNGRKRKKRC